MREQQAGGCGGQHGGVAAMAALLLLVAVTGCARPLPPNSVQLWTPSYAFGTLGYRDFDVRSYCGERGARRLEVTSTPGTLAVSVVTLGVYTPREVRLECR